MKKAPRTSTIVKQVLDRAGLNWSVFKVPLVTQTGATDPSGEKVKSTRLDNWTNCRNHAIVRSDNHNLVGTSSAEWTMMQNSELAEFMVQAAPDHLTAKDFTGGSFDNGTLVYIQAKLPSAYIGKSDINRNITALNSHDAGRSLGFGHSNQVVVCKNAFFSAFRSNGVSKYAHRADLHTEVKIATMQLREALTQEQKLMELFSASAEMDFDDKAKAKMVNALFGYDATRDKDLKDYDALSTRKQNRIADFDSSVTQSIKEQGQTMYALFNGVTRYTNHVLGADERSLMMGQARSLNNKGIATLREIVAERGVVMS